MQTNAARHLLRTSYRYLLDGAGATLTLALRRFDSPVLPASYTYSVRTRPGIQAPLPWVLVPLPSLGPKRPQLYRRSLNPSTQAGEPVSPSLYISLGLPDVAF